MARDLVQIRGSEIGVEFYDQAHNRRLFELTAAVASGESGGAADLSAIAEDVLPSTDDTYDLGSQAKRWSQGWFSDFVSVGNAPAGTGAVRLASGAALTWHSGVDSSNLPWLKHSVVDNFGNVDTLEIGTKWFADPVSLAAFAAVGGYGFMALAGADISATGQQIQLYPALIEISDAAGNPFITFSNVGGVANVQLRGIPTADPGVGRKVWSDSGVLKITAAS